MDAFPRTQIENVSVSRMLIGQLVLRVSHTSAAKDRYIKATMTRDKNRRHPRSISGCRRRYDDGMIEYPA